MDNFIALDFETTGLSASSNEIIEIGAWKVKDGVVVSKFCQLVRPVCYVTRDIQELTGITNEMLASELTFEEVVADFYDFCEDLPFLGHNLDFDYRFICQKSKPLGYDFSLNSQRCGIDTCKLSKMYLKNIENNKLKTVAEYFKISLDAKQGGFHRAGYDAYITKLVYDRFRYLYPNLAGVLIPVVLDKLDTKEYGRVTCADTLSFD